MPLLRPVPMFYSYRKVDSYNCPLKIILAQRGIGKTFGAVKNKCVWKFIKTGKIFIYVVETQEMVKVLTQNHGEKFFSEIIAKTSKCDSYKNRTIYAALTGANISEFTMSKENPTQALTIGGTIKIGGQTAGYIVAYNDYGNLKRNNFTNVGTIVLDEFIPEERDIRNLRDPYKISSVVNTVARLNDVEIVMLANTIRLDDPILERFGLTDIKLGEIRKIMVKGKLLGVCHYVDPAEYQEYTQASSASVAGLFSEALSETNLNKNEFVNTIDSGLLLPKQLSPNHLFCCVHGDGISVRIHATQDYNYYYVLADYGRNTRLRYCLDKKYTSPVVRYAPEFAEILRGLYESNALRFENNTTYFYFKSILKIA